MKYILCIAYLLLSVSGLTFMKIGSMEGGKVIFQILQMKFTFQSLIGYFLYAASFLSYTFVITKFDLNRIIPILGGMINIFIFIIGTVLFREKVTGYSLIGCICIIIGVILMNFK